MNIDNLDQFPEETSQFIELYLNLPLHKWLGLTFKMFDGEFVELEFMTKSDFIGNEYKGILSGGVVAAAMDVACGLLTLLKAMEKMEDLSREEKIQRLINSSTIDLRIDYLKPAKGDVFLLRTRMLRSGKRVSFAQTELFSGKSLIAASTGTYLTG